MPTTVVILAFSIDVNDLDAVTPRSTFYVMIGF
jgi:hypothetical protein